MIVFLIISASLAALVAVIVLISVGVLAVYRGDDLYLAVTVAGFPIPIGGIAEKKQKSKNEGKQKSQTKQSKKKDKKKDFPPINKLLPIIFGALDKLRKSITIKTLEVNYSVGGDPFAAAISCGAITELVGFFTPLAKAVLKIKNYRIVITPNFTEQGNTLDFKACVTIRLGSLLAIAFSALIQFIKVRKENENGKASSGRPDGVDNAQNPRDGRREYHRGNSHTDA